MSSRSNKIYTTSETEPNGAALGDEWHVPSTNILYKRLSTSTGVSWVNINFRIPIGSLVSRPATTDNGTMIINSTSNSIEFYYNSAWNIFKSLGNLEATGGTITYNSGYKIHTFITSDIFTVTNAPIGTTIEYLAVAGGSGGGWGNDTFYGGGGGGAGEVLTGRFIPLTTHTITIGAGGGGGLASSSTSATGGGSTVINSIYSSSSTITSRAGTAGANSGESGGTSGSGYGPGAGWAGNGWGSSGGGAGEAGYAYNHATYPRAGGPGVTSSITGSSVTYGGGGGAGAWYLRGTGPGGTGGGGVCGAGSQATNGSVNTGGAGGGGQADGTVAQNAGGAGGSGIVIIRYLYV